MTDLRATIIPKSDQLNADDLIGRTLDITISKVALLGEAEQPIAIHYEGDNGKPYKPCKSMRRVLVAIWGSDGNKFAGRRLRLYRDEKVQFGGMAVGGIRISHMSDIERDHTMALTASKANRKPFTVKPFPSGTAAPKAEQPPADATLDPAALITEGQAAAERGTAVLQAWWTRLSATEKTVAKPTLDAELKATAARVDEAANLSDDAQADEPTEPAMADADDGWPGPR